jgi:CRP/FNR family nitrogen fixation transcriptional regulator
MRVETLALVSGPAPGPSSADRDAPGFLGVAKSFDEGQAIFCEGDRAGLAYMVIAGAVRTQRLLADGRRQISAFHFPGDIFGLEFEQERRAGAEALGPSVLVAARGDGSPWAKDQAARFLRQALCELQRAQDHVLTLGRRSANERLASFLLDLSGRLGEPTELALPMCRRDIADFLGLTIETVSRTFAQLQAHGLIALHGSRRVRLLDRRGLTALCG